MKLADLDLAKTYTYSDYLKWRFDERVELIKGKIFKMSPASKRKHQKISGLLYFNIASVMQGQQCDIYNAPFDVRFPNADGKTYTVVQPDLCVICDQSKLDEAGCIGVPDLIVEILSDSTARKDYTEKYELYEQSGVKEYWIANPTGFVEVFHLENNSYINKGKYFKGDELKSEAINMLTIDLDKIFVEE